MGIIDLNNRNIIVTGAGSGIGRETSVLLSKEGANVILMDINVESLAETSALCSEKCHAYPIDLTDIASIADVIFNIVSQYGKLDGLVHCAGVSSRKPLNTLTKEGFSKIMDVNFYSFVELVKQCAKKRHFNHGGSIVVMSSISSLVGYKAKSEYCVSKAAVDAFVRCMAQELYPQGIRINSIMPIGVDTPMGRKSIELAESVGAKIQSDDRLVNPKDIANTIAFLLSNAAPSISGVAIPVLMPQYAENQEITLPYRSIVNAGDTLDGRVLKLTQTRSYELFNKRVLCVCDGSHINDVICQRLVQEGASVIQYYPNKIETIDEDIKWLTNEEGNIHGLVYGIVHSDFRPLKFTKPNVVTQIMQDNYSSFIEIMRSLKQHKSLSNGASVVAMSSISSIRAMKAKMAFCSAKAALDAAVRCLAVELADKGIRVNSIQKGVVDADFEKEHIQSITAINNGEAEKLTPLGPSTAEEVANVVAFLLGDATRTITGTSIVIDGGYTA